MTDDLPTHGGRREGSGQKPGGFYATPDNKRYAKARADKEEQIAKIKTLEAARKQLELQQTMGKLVPYDLHHQAITEVVSVTVNWAETIPDILERDAGLSPSQIELVQRLVDGARDTLSQMLLDAADRISGET